MFKETSNGLFFCAASWNVNKITGVKPLIISW